MTAVTVVVVTLKKVSPPVKLPTVIVLPTINAFVMGFFVQTNVAVLLVTEADDVRQLGE